MKAVASAERAREPIPIESRTRDTPMRKVQTLCRNANRSLDHPSQGRARAVGCAEGVKDSPAGDCGEGTAVMRNNSGHERGGAKGDRYGPHLAHREAGVVTATIFNGSPGGRRKSRGGRFGVTFQAAATPMVTHLWGPRKFSAALRKSQ